jgi:hypothetical protein
MTLYSKILVYPEGDTREIDHALRIDEVVDLNGNPLSLPLPTPRMIAYRVYRISTAESRAEVVTSYFLELLTRDKILEYLP